MATEVSPRTILASAGSIGNPPGQKEIHQQCSDKTHEKCAYILQHFAAINTPKDAVILKTAGIDFGGGWH
jgi:hypothetical protein